MTNQSLNDERRSAPRHALNEKVLIKVIADGDQSHVMTFECNAQDFSQNGIRLHGHIPLHLDADLRLKVHLTSDNQDLCLHGLVRWTTETTEHECLAGVELLNDETTDFASWKNKF